MPMADRAFPVIIEDAHESDVHFWRDICAGHIGAIRKIEPTFHTNFIDDGFPCDDKYNDVRRKIEAHAAFLRERARQLIREDASGESMDT
jgi:hypothetical protein